jgi:hypothetical protein
VIKKSLFRVCFVQEQAYFSHSTCGFQVVGLLQSDFQ